MHSAAIIVHKIIIWSLLLQKVILCRITLDSFVEGHDALVSHHGRQTGSSCEWREPGIWLQKHMAAEDVTPPQLSSWFLCRGTKNCHPSLSIFIWNHNIQNTCSWFLILEDGKEGGTKVGGSGGGKRARREVEVIGGPMKNKKLSAAD